MTACASELSDTQLLRYSRHILLNELGTSAQEKFAASHALVIGAGGLGAPAAQFLAAAGVGTLTICDADDVDLTNLQRQILYATQDVGTRKVDAAAKRLAAINPEIRIQRIAMRVGAAELAPLVHAADVVLDCSDNFQTRHAVNAACVHAGRPLVSGAAVRFDGQVAVFDPRQASAPCYHCLFGDGDELEETRCATMGVFAPLVGIVGSMQAAEALKILADVGETLRGRFLIVDALDMRIRELAVPRDPSCPVCGGPMKATRAVAVLAWLACSVALAAPATGPTLPSKEWSAIRQVIGDQVAALRAGDGAKAMTYAAPGIREQFGTPQNFMRMVREGYAALLTARRTQFLEGAVIDDAVVQPLRLVLSDDSVLVALYQMQRQPDGQWRIAGCVIAPSTVQST